VLARRLSPLPRNYGWGRTSWIPSFRETRKGL